MSRNEHNGFMTRVVRMELYCWFVIIAVFFISTSASESCFCGEPDLTNRIVNGKPASKNEFPWQVGLLFKEGSNFKLFCGGSILTDRYILTAAHCFPILSTNFYIAAGAYDIKNLEDAVIVKPSKVKLNNLFNSKNFDGDIALVKTKKRLKFGMNIKPICLPLKFKQEDFEGLQGIVTGWGKLGFKKKTPKILQKVTLPIMSKSDCKTSLVGESVTDNMFCAYLDGKDACQGDSGGPMIAVDRDTFRFVQVGIVSWGVECAAQDHPGVYTKLTNYIDWIVNNTKSSFCFPEKGQPLKSFNNVSEQ